MGLEERYEFRHAQRANIDLIMEFIDQNWKKGHLLATSREFFEYEFADPFNDKVNFILAFDKKTNRLDGICGYYLTARRTDTPDICGSMWAVRKGDQIPPMLGLEVARYLKSLTNYRSEFGVGVNPKSAVPLRKRFFKDDTGKMDHFYLLNDLPDYQIAKITRKEIKRNEAKVDPYQLQQLNSKEEIEKAFDFVKQVKTLPFKDSWYISRRFLHHPVYTYEVYGVMNGEKALALITMRRIEVNGRSVLRIVDFLGDSSCLAGVKNGLQERMDATCEYIDFYCVGIKEKDLLQAGFVPVVENDSNIIPNYFEPYECKNVDLWFNSTVHENYVLCKADADQDRPNQLK